MTKPRKNVPPTPSRPKPDFLQMLIGGIAAAILLYCVLFLTLPFSPLSDPQSPFLRFQFFSLLFHAESRSQLTTMWFGERSTFSFLGTLSVRPSIICIIRDTFLFSFTLFTPLRLVLKPFRLTFCEFYVFYSAIGLSAISFFFALRGLFGNLKELYDVIIVLSVVFIVFYAVFITIRAIHYSRKFKERPIPMEQRVFLSPNRWTLSCWLILTLSLPSLLILFFGGMLPPVEYDVTSYHLPAAKEIFETGTIRFSSNNVYTNMPLGAEMFYVVGMFYKNNATANIGGNGAWYLGALVGKLVIAYCTFLTALGLYSLGRRLHSPQAGLIAFLLYVSTPWISWISTAGLIDCVFGMYLTLAVFAFYLFVVAPSRNLPLLFISGLMTGSAAACKYTAIPFLVVPLTLAAAYYVFIKGIFISPQTVFDSTCVSRLRIKKIVVFGGFLLSVLIACGLWYGKNFYETGNPFYPLLHNVFGDSTGTWDAAKNLRWQHAHSPQTHFSHAFSAALLFQDLRNFLLQSDWLSPILMPFAFLPFLDLLIRKKMQLRNRMFDRRKRTLSLLALYVAFFWMLWWLATHRLERFWVPVLPIIALLAGIGATSFVRMTFSEKISRKSKMYRAAFVGAALVFNTCYTFFPNAICAPGKYSRFGLGIEAARLDPNRVTPTILYFNANPPDGKLLLIGDAEVFDYKAPVLYNSCFNDTPFDDIFFERKSPRSVAGKSTNNKPTSIKSTDRKPTVNQPTINNASLRTDGEIKKRLTQAGISHIIVNWSELQRFRSPGNYGYTSDLVQPQIFDELVRRKILQPQPQIPALPSQAVYRVTAASSLP
ncbi:MAG: glycosyltransferase family 39 protein [Planctomycetaceae bacterium]|jgi:hypothetical protein|nr:glycosyltransferase family 39 protein [Planctomycetaceae bacterium]